MDTVIMGHEELWQVKQERDRIYALPEMSEDDGMEVAELEAAVRRAGRLYRRGPCRRAAAWRWAFRWNSTRAR